MSCISIRRIVSPHREPAFQSKSNTLTTDPARDLPGQERVAVLSIEAKAASMWSGHRVMASRATGWRRLVNAPGSPWKATRAFSFECAHRLALSCISGTNKKRVSRTSDNKVGHALKHPVLLSAA